MYVQGDIGTADEFPRGISSSDYGLVWYYRCRFLDKIVFPKAHRRLMGLAREAADCCTVIFSSVTIRVKGLSMLML